MRWDRPPENHSMEQIKKRNKEALEWLRYALNPTTDMPTVTDWKALMDFANKQALTGICLPHNSPSNMTRELLLKWIGQIQFIEQENKLLNRRIEQLFTKLEGDGFECCLLKGQGNATMYLEPLKRCPGDIDVWVNTDEKTVYEYVKKLFPNEKETYKHIHFPLFSDAPIDVHITPLKFYSSQYSKRLQKWIDKNKTEQFENNIRLLDINKDICVPNGKFNAVYQMGHMLIHLFDEGLGLRQVVDYYYVLKGLNISDSERLEIAATINELGMLRFAKAMMWILSHVLGLPADFCIVEQDERRGKILLEDILEGGNFGHHSQRYKWKKEFYIIGVIEAWRNIKLLSLAPREGMARIVSRVWTAIKHPVVNLKNNKKI